MIIGRKRDERARRREPKKVTKSGGASGEQVRPVSSGAGGSDIGGADPERSDSVYRVPESAPTADAVHITKMVFLVF